MQTKKYVKSLPTQFFRCIVYSAKRETRGEFVLLYSKLKFAHRDREGFLQRHSSNQMLDIPVMMMGF